MEERLEHLCLAPSAQAHPTPVLFVHGGWQGAWCWQDHFLPYFSDHGFEAHALSLRGHGKSTGRERLRWSSIGDYVSDVAHVIQRLPKPPILVGHSMGAWVVQKYLEKHWVPAAVLLAPPPPAGVLRTTLHVMSRWPIAFLRLNLTLHLYPLVATPAMARALLFSESMPDEQLSRHHARLQDEAYRAFLDMLYLNRPLPRRVQLQPLVLGAAKDALFTPDEVQAAARAYGTQAEIFPDMAHEMMLEAGWRAVADRILDWLRAQKL